MLNRTLIGINGLFKFKRAYCIIVQSFESKLAINLDKILLFIDERHDMARNRLTFFFWFRKITI